jgi:hypothetical protein
MDRYRRALGIWTPCARPCRHRRPPLDLVERQADDRRQPVARVRAISEDGLAETYAQDERLNHRPLMGVYAALVWDVTSLPGSPSGQR